jgi:hypothetical protein
MKHWTQSRTIWFNIATLAVALALVGLMYVDQLGLTPLGAMFASMGLTSVITLGNLYLRTVTNTGIGQ